MGFFSLIARYREIRVSMCSLCYFCGGGENDDLGTGIMYFVQSLMVHGL